MLATVFQWVWTAKLKMNTISENSQGLREDKNKDSLHFLFWVIEQYWDGAHRNYKFRIIQSNSTEKHIKDLQS